MDAAVEANPLTAPETVVLLALPDYDDAKAVKTGLIGLMAQGCLSLEERVEKGFFGDRTVTCLRVNSAPNDGQALAVLADIAGYRSLGEAASVLVREHYSQDVCMPRLAERFTALAGAGRQWS